jgi:maltose alpha-D-glucosyltransferase/alpha-amylase
VEAQINSSASLLHWTRRMIEVRKQHPAFATGSFTELEGSNPGVFAFLREHLREDGVSDVALCVHNLTRFPQPVALDLARFAGQVPLELTGRTPFTRIGTLPYLLTLPGHGFFWLQISDPSRLSAGARGNVPGWPGDAV